MPKNWQKVPKQDKYGIILSNRKSARGVPTSFPFHQEYISTIIYTLVFMYMYLNVDAMIIVSHSRT